MGRSISATTILNNDYPRLEVSDHVKKLLGNVEVGFKMLIYGPSGSFKTTFAINELAIYLAKNHGKVYYNSIEEGDGASIQDTLRYCETEELEDGSLVFKDLPDGRFMFGDRDSLAEMMDKIERTKPKFIFIDSSDFLRLTSEQYKKLEKLCNKPRKSARRSLIIISWSKNGVPKSQYMKDVEYMVDIKTYIEDGIVNTRSRFGKTEPYHVLKRKFIAPKIDRQQSIFNN